MQSYQKLATCILSVVSMSAAVPALAEDVEPQCFYESRSGVNVECGVYAAEISNSRAFLETVVNPGQAVILDVRSTPEYRAGHPENSYNVPYPFIYQSCDDVGDVGPDDDRRPDGACISGGPRIGQPAEDFVAYVEELFPLPEYADKPIYTMCRTGVRSVGAANRLTEAGYTNVRNMWEGFVGIYLLAPQVVGFEKENNKNKIAEIIDLAPVDLNHDGKFTDEDKNGWIYHQGLPYSTELKDDLIYGPAEDTYYWD